MSETFLKLNLCNFQANNKAGVFRGRHLYPVKILSGIRLVPKSILGESPSFNL
jgi:hypothetical protein